MPYHTARSSRTAVLTLLSLLLLVCTGCPRKTTQTFVLDYPAVESKPAPPAIAKHLFVAEFTAASEYARQPFVYRTSAHRIHFDPVRRWAIAPEDMIHERVTRFLRGAGLFARVTAPRGLKAPDLILRGHILRIGEGVKEGARFAELALQLELLDAADETLLWSATLERSEPVDAGSFEPVIAALSVAFREILEETVSRIKDEFPKK